MTLNVTTDDGNDTTNENVQLLPTADDDTIIKANVMTKVFASDDDDDILQNKSSAAAAAKSVVMTTNITL